jgi:DNA alkylation damage repair protein AlkB
MVTYACGRRGGRAGRVSPAARAVPSIVSARVVDRCRALVDGDVPAYVPVVRGGGKMHVRMLCLGRHWNGKTYTYEPTRSDFDNLPAPPLPDDFSRARTRARRVGRDVARADLCILNYYDAEGRMGLHQDKDESVRSLEAGLPVVSVSLGDTARFLFGGLRRKDPVEARPLESGDAFVFGGPSRLRYHGVSRIVPNTAPPELALRRRIQPDFQAVRHLRKRITAENAKRAER